MSNKLLLNYFNQKASNSVPQLITDYSTISKKWVDWGKKDAMPTRLFELYNASGEHHAIIDGKVNMLVGDGLQQEGDFSQRTQDFIEHPNKYESLDEVATKLAYDYNIYGIAYIEVIYSRDKLSIASVEHIDANMIRWGVKSKNRLTHVYYSENFKKSNTNVPVAIPVFNPHIKDEYPRQIIPIVRYSPSVPYYTLPSYYAGIKWISISDDIGRFHSHNIQNGFSPSIIISIPADATEEEQKQISDSLKEKYAGADNSGGVIVLFHTPGADNEVKVTTVTQSDIDSQYEWLSSHTRQEILIAHKVVSENLLGISTPGKLSGSSEIIQSYELYYNSVIRSDQKDILVALNKIMAYNGMNDVSFIKNTPISQELSENTLTQILDKNELRDIIGYEAVETSGVTSPVAQGAQFVKDPCSGNCKHEHNEQVFTPNMLVDVEDAGKVFEFMEFDDDGNEIGLKKVELVGEIIDKNTLNTNIINADVTGMWAWTLGKGGESKKNCPSCIGYAGKIRSLSGWKRTAIPGKSAVELQTTYRTEPYGSFCEQNCTCKLIKTN